MDYINTTITNTIIPYLSEINSTTHTTYSYLTDTINPNILEINSTVADILTKWGTYNASELYNKINDTYNLANDTKNDTEALLDKWGTYTAQQLYNISNATYIRTGEIYSGMATASALSSMQTDVTWLVSNVATQTNITLINSKLDTINSTVNTIKNQTDCSTPTNSELCTFLNSINTTVNTIYSEMSTQENISAILSDTNWLVSNVATQANISALNTQLSNLQTDIDWLKNNTATQENITELLNRLTGNDNNLTDIHLTNQRRWIHRQPLQK